MATLSNNSAKFFFLFKLLILTFKCQIQPSILEIIIYHYLEILLNFTYILPPFYRILL